MTDWTDFAEYIDARRDALVRAACLLVGDQGNAEDLVQSALIRVWPHWQRISANGDPEAYVRKAIFHQFASQARTRRRREVTADLRAGWWTERSDQATPDATAAVDTRLQVRDALAVLGPRQRAVLVLRYYLDLSEAETAAVLGCSVGTPNMCLHPNDSVTGSATYAGEAAWHSSGLASVAHAAPARAHG